MVLSICIPTHNGRREALRRALESVTAQLDENVSDAVEICVSDNASRDGTAEMVASLEGPIRYHRNLRDLGLVPNLFGSIAMARGRFCWLLGSDDTIAAGGLAQVLTLVREHPDVGGVTVNRVRTNDRDPAWLAIDAPDELPDEPERMHVYTTSDDIFRNVGLPQDFMSTQIINKVVWDDALSRVSRADLEWAGALSHLYVLGLMAQDHPSWIWWPERLVRHTTGTSALDEELGHRYAEFLLVIMDGRAKIWSRLLGGHSPLYRTLMRKAYLRGARPSALIGLKLWPNHRVVDDLRLLGGLVRFCWFVPDLWRVGVPLMLIPHWAYKFLSRFKWAMVRAWSRFAGRRHPARR